jgi:hypothetical protein
VAAALALTATAMIQTPSARAAAPSVFGASASAGGFEFSFTNSRLPVVQTYEFTTPATAATISSLGDSQSFASAPYPGDVVQNLPSVAGALVPVPIPPYPFYVAAGSGEDPKEVNYPGLNLRAEAGATVVQARGSVGADGAGGVSSSRTEVLGDGAVRAIGSAVYKILDLGSQVTFHGVDSVAEVTASANGKLTRTSSLSIARIQIPGLAVTIPQSSPATVPLPNPIPGTPQAPPARLPQIPLGAAGGRTIEQPDIGFDNGRFSIVLPFLGGNRYELPATVLADALKAAGISMTFQQTRTTKTGLIAPALTVSYDVAAPPDNPLYSGPGTVRYVVGATAASANVQPDNAASSTGTSATTDPGAANPADSGSGSVPADEVDPAAGVLPSFGAGIGNGTIPFAPGSTAPVHRDGANDVSLVSADKAIYSAPFTKDLSAIYLIVVALAAVAVLASVLRQLGVRAR